MSILAIYKLVSNFNDFDTKLSFLRLIDEKVYPSSNTGHFARLLAQSLDRRETRYTSYKAVGFKQNYSLVLGFT